jgi:hypothetical protein
VPIGSGRRRSWSHAGTASASAATATRAVTAAPGDHPARSRLVPNDPDVANAAEESSTSSSPRLILTGSPEHRW